MKADKITASFPIADKKQTAILFLFLKRNSKREKNIRLILIIPKSVIAKHALWDGGWMFTKDKTEIRG